MQVYSSVMAALAHVCVLEIANFLLTFDDPRLKIAFSESVISSMASLISPMQSLRTASSALLRSLRFASLETVERVPSSLSSTATDCSDSRSIVFVIIR